MDMIQVPFVDLGDGGGGDIDHIDIWNRTLRILLENNILEIENKDKFSAWWDLAQDANEGTTLYYLSDYPDITSGANSSNHTLNVGVRRSATFIYSNPVKMSQ